MRVRATLETTTRNMAIMGWATLLGAGLVGIYGLINAWANITSGVAALTLMSSDFSRPSAATWSVAPDASLTWPYQVMVPVAQIPSPARWLIQGGDALTPLLWAASIAALGLVLVRVGSARSVFDRQVRRALNILAGCLIVLALVPTGMVLFGVRTGHWEAWAGPRAQSRSRRPCGYRCLPFTFASPSPRRCDMGPGSRRNWTR